MEKKKYDVPEIYTKVGFILKTINDNKDKYLKNEFLEDHWVLKDIVLSSDLIRNHPKGCVEQNGYLGGFKNQDVYVTHEMSSFVRLENKFGLSKYHKLDIEYKDDIKPFDEMEMP